MKKVYLHIFMSFIIFMPYSMYGALSPPYVSPLFSSPHLLTTTPLFKLPKYRFTDPNMLLDLAKKMTKQKVIARPTKESFSFMPSGKTIVTGLTLVAKIGELLYKFWPYITAGCGTLLSFLVLYKKVLGVNNTVNKRADALDKKVDATHKKLDRVQKNQLSLLSGQKTLAERIGLLKTDIHVDFEQSDKCAQKRAKTLRQEIAQAKKQLQEQLHQLITHGAKDEQIQELTKDLEELQNLFSAKLEQAVQDRQAASKKIEYKLDNIENVLNQMATDQSSIKKDTSILGLLSKSVQNSSYEPYTWLDKVVSSDDNSQVVPSLSSHLLISSN